MDQPSALAIRRFDKADLPAALAIQGATYPTFLIEDAAAFASRIALPASYCLAAVRGGALVGYLLAHGWGRQAPPPVGAVLAAAPANEVLFVHDLAVSPGERGSGAGRQLVLRAFEQAAGDGLSTAELVAVDGAAGYWRLLGFVEDRIRPELAAKVAAYGPRARWMTCEIGGLPRAGSLPI